MHRFLLAIGALVSLAACSSEPQTSYCQAVCDNAVSCHEEARGADGDALMADCLAATKASDEDCAAAENGELDPATAKLLTKCTDALATEAGECDAYTGRIDDLKTGTTPAACLTYNPGAQDVYDDARQATQEGNDEMCERFADSFCGQTTSCLEAELGDAYQTAADKLGYSAYDSCRDKTNNQYQSCVTDAEYAPEEDFTDANASRQSARECLTDFASLTCDQLFSGDMPALCAGAVEDPTAYAGALLDVATEFRDNAE